MDGTAGGIQTHDVLLVSHQNALVGKDANRQCSVQTSRKGRHLLTTAYVEAEYICRLRSVEHRALIGSQVNPVRSLYFSGSGEASHEVSVGVKFQKSMATSGLSYVGVSRVVKDN